MYKRQVTEKNVGEKWVRTWVNKRVKMWVNQVDENTNEGENIGEKWVGNMGGEKNI